MKSASKKPSAFDKKPETEKDTPVHTEVNETDSTSSKTASTNSLSKIGFINRTILIGIILFVTVAGIGTSAYYYMQYQTSQKLLKDPVLGTRIEAEKTIEKVAKIVELPQEKPTLATVSDVTKLKGQPFFANAKNGDKVLIYQTAKKAILYRPSTNKIVEFGPINLGSSTNSAKQKTASPSASVTLKPVKVAIYNGTTAPGLAVAAEQQLKSKAANVSVVTKGNAAKKDYVKTLVVDVTGANSGEAKNIALLLKGEVGKLPAGEKATSSAEIVVIIGR